MPLSPAILLVAAALLVLPAVAADPRKPAQDGLVYGEADGQKLTTDYYAPAGPGVHPIASKWRAISAVRVLPVFPREGSVRRR